VGGKSHSEAFLCCDEFTLPFLVRSLMLGSVGESEEAGAAEDAVCGSFEIGGPVK
jgi:hypothetical protein